MQIQKHPGDHRSWDEKQTFCLNIPGDKRKNADFDILTGGLLFPENIPATWAMAGAQF